MLFRQLHPSPLLNLAIVCRESPHSVVWLFGARARLVAVMMNHATMSWVDFVVLMMNHDDESCNHVKDGLFVVMMNHATVSRVRIRLETWLGEGDR